MSIFGKIMGAIFGHPAAAQGNTPGAATGASPSGITPSTSPVGQPAKVNIDVEAVLKQMEAGASEKLDWRRSIVDLMKLLKLDSSLSARKELAHELGYKGELTGSAEMNTWLHKQVMQKLADNGGKVPADLH